MSPTATATAKSSLMSHPLIVSVLAPIVLAVLSGALTVWMTQATLISKVSDLKTDVDKNKVEVERQVNEVKSQVVPRPENEARWNALVDQLKAINEQTAHTNERVDKMYDWMLSKQR